MAPVFFLIKLARVLIILISPSESPEYELPKPIPPIG